MQAAGAEEQATVEEDTPDAQQATTSRVDAEQVSGGHKRIRSALAAAADVSPSLHDIDQQQGLPAKKTRTKGLREDHEGSSFNVQLTVQQQQQPQKEPRNVSTSQQPTLDRKQLKVHHLQWATTHDQFQQAQYFEEQHRSSHPAGAGAPLHAAAVAEAVAPAEATAEAFTAGGSAAAIAAVGTTAAAAADTSVAQIHPWPGLLLLSQGRRQASPAKTAAGEAKTEAEADVPPVLPAAGGVVVDSNVAAAAVADGGRHGSGADGSRGSSTGETGEASRSAPPEAADHTTGAAAAAPTTAAAWQTAAGAMPTEQGVRSVSPNISPLAGGARVPSGTAAAAAAAAGVPTAEFDPDMIPRGIQRDMALQAERRAVAEAVLAELNPNSLGPDTNLTSLVHRMLKCRVLRDKTVEYRKRAKTNMPHNTGHITAAGLILCSCHGQEVTMSEFEQHSHSQIRRPAEYIFIKCVDMSLKGFARLVLHHPIDSSLWYCMACREGGELLCCDGCPAAVHRACLGEQIPPAPDHGWLCTDCLLSGKQPSRSARGPVYRITPVARAAARTGGISGTQHDTCSSRGRGRLGPCRSSSDAVAMGRSLGRAASLPPPPTGSGGFEYRGYSTGSSRGCSTGHLAGKASVAVQHPAHLTGPYSGEGVGGPHVIARGSHLRHDTVHAHDLGFMPEPRSAEVHRGRPDSGRRFSDGDMRGALGDEVPAAPGEGGPRSGRGYIHSASLAGGQEPYGDVQAGFARYEGLLSSRHGQQDEGTTGRWKTDRVLAAAAEMTGDDATEHMGIFPGAPLQQQQQQPLQPGRRIPTRQPSRQLLLLQQQQQQFDAEEMHQLGSTATATAPGGVHLSSTSAVGASSARIEVLQLLLQVLRERNAKRAASLPPPDAVDSGAAAESSRHPMALHSLSQEVPVGAHQAIVQAAGRFLHSGGVEAMNIPDTEVVLQQRQRQQQQQQHLTDWQSLTSTGTAAAAGNVQQAALQQQQQPQRKQPTPPPGRETPMPRQLAAADWHSPLGQQQQQPQHHHQQQQWDRVESLAAAADSSDSKAAGPLAAAEAAAALNEEEEQDERRPGTFHHLVRQASPAAGVAAITQAAAVTHAAHRRHTTEVGPASTSPGGALQLTAPAAALGVQQQQQQQQQQQRHAAGTEQHRAAVVAALEASSQLVHRVCAAATLQEAQLAVAESGAQVLAALAELM